MTSTIAEWSQVDDLVDTLRRRWASGKYLRDYASGIEWQPVSMSLRGPKAAELLDHFDAVNAWLGKFERDCTRWGFDIEYRTIGTRSAGQNRVPVRIVIPTRERLFALLGVVDDIRSLEAVLDETRQRVPRLVDWVRAHPAEAVGLRSVWTRLLSTATWVFDHDVRHLYVRHIDAEGVDTKFVDQHKLVLGRLLDAMLPEDRIDVTCGRADFAGRYGFTRKPVYTRLRFLSDEAALQSGLPHGITEMVLRTDELARFVPSVSRVYVVENEITYLALPGLLDAIAVFGEGFALAHLHKLDWLEAKDIVYWGDIDTHGFVMLDRMRERFGSNVRSMMMDVHTLLDHAEHWGTEPEPTSRSLAHLNSDEADLYKDLVEDRYGYHLRLEQERVRFHHVRASALITNGNAN